MQAIVSPEQLPCTAVVLNSPECQVRDGYCRRSLKEYLNYMNYALGSCGEFHSCYERFKQAEQITDDAYEDLDKLHFKIENSLLKLIETLQKKQKESSWEDTF